ncbi:hypothetical protein [Streptomyces cylindrosporus]|uniref:DUF4237 domain-containing protein n=1 Tax=Streptomyces cylindrosporus TaxID=2927583 RepID=A0ABS9YK42_9ACTN|nr:hypothetical protein [Streptomyces cylindrosporus]MCI3277564.1 hypothetical protein [Streptomyces cylindrosporus]
MTRRNWAVDIITETLVKLVPGASEARTTVTVAHTLDRAMNAADTWTGSPQGLAERLATALYGRGPQQQSPLEAAQDAKRARDIGGEIGALRAGDRALKTAPWYPSRAGDLVHVHYEAAGSAPAWGETYAVEPGEGFYPGELELRLLHHTAPDAGLAGCFAPTETPDEPLYQLWFEAGPHTLTVVRNGRTVHDGRRA